MTYHILTETALVDLLKVGVRSLIKGGFTSTGWHYEFLKENKQKRSVTAPMSELSHRKLGFRKWRLRVWVR